MLTSFPKYVKAITWSGMWTVCYIIRYSVIFWNVSGLYKLHLQYTCFSFHQAETYSWFFILLHLVAEQESPLGQKPLGKSHLLYAKPSDLGVLTAHFIGWRYDLTLVQALPGSSAAQIWLAVPGSGMVPVARHRDLSWGACELVCCKTLIEMLHARTFWCICALM